MNNLNSPQDSGGGWRVEFREFSSHVMSCPGGDAVEVVVKLGKRKVEEELFVLFMWTTDLGFLTFLFLI